MVAIDLSSNGLGLELEGMVEDSWGGVLSRGWRDVCKTKRGKWRNNHGHGQ